MVILKYNIFTYMDISYCVLARLCYNILVEIYE